MRVFGLPYRRIGGVDGIGRWWVVDGSVTEEGLGNDQ